MRKIFFLLKTSTDDALRILVEKHIDSAIVVEYGDTLPDCTDDYELIILWNYHKIINNLSDKNNFVVFHSSDLPKGKGWAPIFNALNNQDEYFFITAIKATDFVDSGDIIAQAKFKIMSNYTAKYIREWDEEICILLCKKILEKFKGNCIIGKKQVGEGNFNPRRYPKDNEVDSSKTLNEISSFLRATEQNFPAFFYVDGEKYYISITPEKTPSFPEDLEFIFYS